MFIEKNKKMAYKFVVSVLILLFTVVFLTGCAVGSYKTYEEYVASMPQGCQPVPRECFEQAVAGGTFNMYDWAAWWPEELYNNFEKEFGIKIVRDNYPDHDTALTKFRLNPNVAYDYFYGNPKDLNYMRNAGILKEINHGWVPNVNKYLKEDIKNASWDPGYKHSICITLGFDGYVINTNFIDKNDPRIPSWKFVFEGWDAYKDRLILRNDMDRVIGETLKYLGYSLNSTNEKELMEAKEALIRLKPHVMAFDSWPKKAVVPQEGWVVEGAVHDYLPLGKLIGSKNPFYPCYPPEGCLLSAAGLLIPKGGSNPAAAHLFINYLYRPKNFATLINAIAYGYTHTGIDNLLTEEVKKWSAPPEGYFKKCEILGAGAFSAKGEELRSKVWEEVRK